MEYWELQQFQGLPLEVKILKTKLRIREWYDYHGGMVYVSFSGGKDSTVLLDIAREMYPEIEAVFVDTGLEYPEIRDFVKTIDNVTWLKPKMNFKEVVRTYGYPVIGKKQARFIRDLQNASDSNKATTNLRLTGYNRQGKYCSSQILAKKWRFLVDAPFKISEQCCDIMKKIPAKQYNKVSGKYPIIATMASESKLRENSWLNYGCNMYNASTPMSRPMSFWSDNDVLTYLYDHQIDIAGCYGNISFEGVDSNNIAQYATTLEKRTGCMFCMFGAHLDDTPNRFERMKKTHPKQYHYCMNSLGLREVLEYLRINF